MATTKITTDNIDLSGNTGALEIPTGTTAQRPGTPTEGMIRENITTGKMEVYTGTTGWRALQQT
tara:strand:+ start:1690 stop:1881 length:192 start_codon:yes stop_codon:yes gene_type:complete